MTDIVKRLREGRADGTELRWSVRDEHLEAADEIERLREQTQWRPIETAPKKQGTEVLVFVPEIGGPILARHIALIDFLTEDEILREQVENGATDNELEEPDWFYADFCHGARLTEGRPTHWMPLPPPPETTE